MSVLTLPQADGLSLSVRAKALVFEDPRSQELLDQIRQVAPSQATILITGETGTGKEIVARHCHELSRRRERPFVGVNCGAFSENLVESELFGHEKGAFTGATESKLGWFEAAHTGTLFLDEVGDLSLPVQVKLLRVLQESEVVRIGSRKPIPIDVRLIAATNVDLEEAMAAGHFREDLFYRLNVTTLRLPPLRERPGDIVPLAEYFLDLYQRRLGLENIGLAPSAAQRLLEHPWPGNIRELENAIHHALLVCKSDEVTAGDLRLTVFRPKLKAASSPPPGPAAMPASGVAPPVAQASLEATLIELFEQSPPNLFEHIEQRVMRAAYEYCDKNQLQTARLLGISRNIVRARLLQSGVLAVSPRGGATRSPVSVRRSLPARAVRSGESDSRVRIGYQKFGLLSVVRAQGELDAALQAQGADVQWSEYPGGLQLLEALERGQVSIGVVGECPTVFAQAQALPIVYLAAETPAPEAQAILVHKDSPLESVADLRGRSIALNRGSNVHYLLIRALEEAGLDYDAVESVFLSPDGGQAAFENAEVDAWAIWDPLLSSVRQTTGARVLRDGRGLTQNTAYYVASRGFAEAHPEIVRDFAGYLTRAVRWAQSQSERVAELLAGDLGLSELALSRYLRRTTGVRPFAAEFVREQQQIADALYRVQLIPRALSIADAHWPSRLAG